jgi:formate dehydrogenase iron-sulfur subunit
MGQVTFWATLVYLAFRLGDLAATGQLPGAFTDRYGGLFTLEIASAVLALVLLSRDVWRSRPAVTATAAALTAGGIILHRIDVVYLAMHPTGPMPWTAPSSYLPAWPEWGLSIGLIAATVFLFGVGARRLPILPKPDTGEAPAST